MNILEAVLGTGDGGAVRQIGEQFGLDESQVTSAISALVPALAGGFQKNMSSEGGLEALLGALGSGRHQRYVEDPGSLLGADTIADGNGILGHVLGSKDVSRHVAARAATQTGIGEGILKKMLPIVAAMMMGSMSKHGMQGAGAGLPGLGGGAGSGLLGMLAPMLDGNRDGSVVDDVMGMVGKMFGGR
jgi:hypothetical protein